MKKWLINLLKLAFIALCFCIISRKIHFHELAGHFANLSPGWVAAAWLTVLLEPVVIALKWNLLLREKGINLRLPHLVRIVFTSNFLSTALPFSFGADALRLMLVKREQHSLTHAASSLVADRILGTLAIVTLSLAGVAWAGPALLDRQTVWSILGIAAVLFAIIAVLISPLPVFWAPLLKRGLTGRGRLAERAVHVAERVVAVHESLRSFRHHRAELAQVFALNLLTQALRVLQIVLLFRAVPSQVAVPLSQTAAFVPMIVMFTLLPLSYFGLGIKEGAFIYFFGRAGVPGAVCVAVSLITYPLIFGAMLPGAAFVLRDVFRRPAARPR